MNMRSPMHPGKVLRQMLLGIEEETGTKLTVTSVAESLDTSRNNLTAILQGKAGISAAMAIKLGLAFNDKPEFWMRLQENYDLAEARKKHKPGKVKVIWARPGEANIPLHP